MQIVGVLAVVSLPTVPYEVSTHRYLGAKAVERSSVLAPTLARLEWNLPETTFAGPSLAALNADLDRVSEARVSNPRAVDLIVAGCATEDAHDRWSPSSWRFLNHFLDGVTFQGFNLGLLGAPSDVWASTQASNVFNWDRARTHFVASLTEQLPADREAHRVDLFRSLGQVLHLIQDAHQPSHTRDDSHSNHVLVPDGYSALEVWAARAVSLDGANLDSSVATAVRNSGGATYRNRIVDYVRESAARTNREFFSDDTIWQSLLAHRYAHPDDTETYEGTEGTFPFTENYVFATTALHNTIPPLKMARERSGLRDLVDSMGDPRQFTLLSPDDDVVRGHAVTLIPRAVSECAGAINHFFRLGIEADIDTITVPSEGRLKLTNVSSVPGASASDLTIAAGATVTLRYETVSGRMLPVPGVVVPSLGGLAPGVAVTTAANVLAPLQALANPITYPDPNVRARTDLKFVAVIEGVVGQEQSVGADLWSRECPENFPTPPGTVAIQAGSFQMGSNAASGPPYFGPLGPVHDVTISYCFWMGQHEVTQSEYAALMGTNPSYYLGANNPVDSVTWFDAQAYCAALTAQQSALGNVPASYQYRLPTEAEWEYACRAATTTEFNVGGALFCSDANFYWSYHSNSYCGVLSTVPVGNYAPNAWGLYDMHGNVWEWCLDSYADYSAAPATDPFVTGGYRRVVRGGGWAFYSSSCLSASRWSGGPGATSNYIGFRVVLAPVLVP